jgi:hypothetical protein
MVLCHGGRRSQPFRVQDTAQTVTHNDTPRSLSYPPGVVENGRKTYITTAFTVQSIVEIVSSVEFLLKYFRIYFANYVPRPIEE